MTKSNNQTKHESIVQKRGGSWKKFSVKPTDLLAEAEQEEQRERTEFYLIEYGRATEVLRRKGFTWAMVAEWFAQRGITVDRTSLKDANWRWGKTNDYLAFCKEVDKEKELDKI